MIPKLPLPAGVTKIYVVCRQNTLAEDWIAGQEYPRDLKIRKIFYLDPTSPLLANEETLFVALTTDSDPISFRESVGREKIFFRHYMVLKF